MQGPIFRFRDFSQLQMRTENKVFIPEFAAHKNWEQSVPANYPMIAHLLVRVSRNNLEPELFKDKYAHRQRTTLCAAFQ